MRFIGLALFASLLSVGAAQAQPADPVAKGAALFSTNCVSCHNGPGMDLKTFPAADKDRFTTTVLKGKDYMPAWEGTLKPDDVEAVWAYVRSIGLK